MIESLFDEDYRNHWPTHVHANGDAAVDQLIAALKPVHAKYGPGDRRHVLIHGQFVHRTDQLPALKELQVIPSASWAPRNPCRWPLRSLVSPVPPGCRCRPRCRSVLPCAAPCRATRRNPASSLGALWNPDEARSRLMDAAITCLQRYGMEKTGLGDIASAAGVTKPTLYAYFENRDDLLRRALIRSADAFRLWVVAHAQRFASPADRIVEAMLFALRELPNEPGISAISPGPASDFVARHALRPYTLELTRNGLEEILGGRRPDADELAEVMIRWSLSLLTYQPPKRRSEARLRSLLHRRMIPGLGLDG